MDFKDDSANFSQHTEPNKKSSLDDFKDLYTKKGNQQPNTTRNNKRHRPNDQHIRNKIYELKNDDASKYEQHIYQYCVTTKNNNHQRINFNTSEITEDNKIGIKANINEFDNLNDYINHMNNREYHQLNDKSGSPLKQLGPNEDGTSIKLSNSL